MDAIRSYQPDFLANVPISLQVITAGFIFVSLYTIYSLATIERPLKGFPVVALREKGLGPKRSWFTAGNETIAKGLRENPSCFQIVTGTGPKIVVPNRFAEELRNLDELSFNLAFQKDFFTDYHGFDAFRMGLNGQNIIAETTRVKLTQSLNLITHDLVDETTSAVRDIFGENPEWHAIALKESILELVARLSSRVFLGKGLCHNRRWLDIAKDYTVDSFIASRLLRLMPPLFRPILYWGLPHARRIRGQVRDARQIIQPEVDKRKERVEKALEAGQKPPKTADAIGWMYEVARGRDVDFVAGQLSMTLAAIHTTTEALAQALVDMCEHPEIVEPLREEVVTVISETGWTKAALQKLRKMDSFLKECQRFHPTSHTTMNRHVVRDVELSDGTLIPAGSRLMVATAYFDPAAYDSPETFDAFRFSNKRLEPGQVNLWGHVATSPMHLGFGHGQHACPGRFFASNEIKTALCHLLLKYDWRFVEGEAKPTYFEFEGNSGVDPKCRVELRRREEEIVLDLE